MTVASLADDFGVSRRTLMRDIALLRDRGLPVEADRGRGGGVRLHRSWGIGRLVLSYREAVDLLVSLAIAEQLQSPWLIANLSSIRHKLTASFSPSLRDRIASLRQRILIGQSASSTVIGSIAPPDGQLVAPLFQAFLELRLLRIGYTDTVGRRSSRVIEPQLLLLNYPVWYTIAWDRRRGAVRSFRCDRLCSAELLEETFRLRSAETFADALAGVGAITP